MPWKLCYILHRHWGYFPVAHCSSILLTVLENSSIPAGFRKVKACGPCRDEQYSSATPVPCIDPPFSEWPSFQLLLKIKNYSRGNSFLPKQPPSQRLIPEKSWLSGKRHYQSGVPGQLQQLLSSHTQASLDSYRPRHDKNPLCLLVSKPNLWEVALNA